jgi:2-oxoglutarate dehydrogenase E2 component (dihydrolipoamide succinyltransferase)/2-oxoisovalerate dehydrogenase E2 component (dihydrolipoyl transacylase)
VPTDIIMPQLGESIAEGTVVKWLIPTGGRVEKDQSLLEVETDKVALEIPSPAAGYLTEVFVKEGETVPVGTLIARLEEVKPDGVVNKVAGVILRHMEPPEGGRDYYSPAVRQLAKEKGVDLAQVTGTGAGGRVTRKDVLDYLAKREATQPKATPTHPAPGAPVAPQIATGHGEGKGEGEEILPFTPMRKTIAERMVKSRQTSAHVVTFFEADFSAIARFREGKTLTYLPFVVNAVTRAIKDVPLLNSSWGEAGIVIKKDVHIGIAVALEEGLLVPVVRHADRKGLTQLAKEVTDLAERARTKKLSPEEVQGGTFTITNHGGLGSLFSTPIIHQPQIAIMGVGAVQKRPVVINDAIAIRPMCYLSLSFDHRVIDGATADQFMSKVKAYLEQSPWEKYL